MLCDRKACFSVILCDCDPGSLRFRALISEQMIPRVEEESRGVPDGGELRFRAFQRAASSRLRPYPRMALQTVFQQATQELRMEIAAYYQGVLPTDMDPEVLGHEFGSDARRAFMYGRAATIYGGSNEVQKNIISKYVLGLE